MPDQPLPFDPDESLAGDLLIWLPEDLAPGEKVLWVGRPEPVRAFVVRWWPVAVLVFAFTAFSSCVIIPFLLAGRLIGVIPCVGLVTFLGTIGTPVVRAWRNAGGLRYVLTDRRLVIRDFHSDGRLYERETLPGTVLALWKTERPDGSGNLLFQLVPSTTPGPVEPVGFFGVANVRGVESMVRDVLRPDAFAGTDH